MPEFKIKISADTQQFGADIARTVGIINSQLAGGLRGKLARLFSFEGITSQAREAIRFASEFNDAAQKLGVGVEFLQQAAFAAKQTGANLGDVEMALKRLQVAQVAALGGNDNALAAFSRFGVDSNKLRTSNVEALFRVIAENIQKANPSAQQLSDTIQLMGRSADALIPAFREGFSEMAKRAYELGLVLDDVTIAKLDEMGDRMDQLNLKWKVFMSNVVATGGTAFERGLRFLHTAVFGAPAAFLGTVSGGGGLKEAVAAWGKTIEEFRDQIDTEEAAIEENASRRRSRTSIAPLDTFQSALAAGGRRSGGGGLTFSADDLARAGKFISAEGPAFSNIQIGLQRRLLSETQTLVRETQKQTSLMEDRL